MGKLLQMMLVFYFLIFLGNNRNNFTQDSITIRVINRSDEVFSDVILFSTPFKDLEPGDISEFKKINYNPLKDDSLIYCTTKNLNLARYLKIPENSTTRYSYTIDSLRSRIIYVSWKKE